MKKWIKDYLTFSRKERNAAIVVSLLIVFFLVLPYVYPTKNATITVDEESQWQLDSLLEQAEVSEPAKSSTANYPHQTFADKQATVFEPFFFDPNTVDEQGWKKLGLRDKTIHTIINYRNKGGKFKQPEDIRKIWGLQPEEAERMIPYIKIASISTTDKFNFKSNQAPSNSPTKPTQIDINKATANDLKFMAGMTNGLPYKIIKYREKLGGFLRLDQLKETFGMNDTAMQQISLFCTLDNPTITQINLNTAQENELSSHPYIDKNLAKALVLYRQLHGNYHQVEDIKKIVFIKEPLYQKISPYLKVN